MSQNFSGTYTAIITPFREDKSIDYPAIEALIEDQVNAGIEGIVVAGTTGESPTLTWNEQDKMIKFYVEKAAGRIQIIAGTGSNCTLDAVKHSQLAENNGADALLIVTPYYNKPTPKGIIDYFNQVCQSVSLPVIVYNIEGRCGVNIDTPTLKKIANQNPNCIGVKEASGNLEQMEEVRKTLGKKFVILSGDDALTVDMIERGGNGVISVISNIMPQETKAMVDTALEGNIEEARILEKNFGNKMDICFIETNPIPIKTLVAKAGKCEEVFRSPMCTMEAETKAKLLEEFSDIL